MQMWYSDPDPYPDPHSCSRHWRTQIGVEAPGREMRFRMRYRSSRAYVSILHGVAWCMVRWHVGRLGSMVVRVFFKQGIQKLIQIQWLLGAGTAYTRKQGGGTRVARRGGM